MKFHENRFNKPNVWKINLQENPYTTIPTVVPLRAVEFCYFTRGLGGGVA